MFLAHKTTVMALGLSLSKHSLLTFPANKLSHFSPKCSLSVFSVCPSFINHHSYQKDGRRRPIFSAVATEITETPAAPPPGEGRDADADATEGKIVLPTNQSSERLLRIRHTVIFDVFSLEGVP